MKAAQPFSGHSLPKKYFGKRTLRQCATRGKGDNIVLIEVDSDDFGDVIILDVPESFQEKFRKNKEHHVISVDDDGDNDDASTSNDASTSRAAEYDMANDATTSNRFSSASAVRSSNCPNIVEGGLFVGEGSKPVKLSTSKRTYSGTGISRNRYGLSSDSESCSSESGDSDCELMEDTFGELREQWEKASFRRRHDTSCGNSDAEDKAGPSASNPPVHNSAEEASAEHSEATSGESTPNHESVGQKFAEENKLSEQDSDVKDMECPAPSGESTPNHESVGQKFAEENKLSEQDSDENDMDGLFTRKHDHHHGSSDLENDAGACESDQPFHHSSERSATEHSDLPCDNLFSESSFLSHGLNGVSSDFAESLAEQSKSSQQGNEAEKADNISAGGHSDDLTQGRTNRDVVSGLAAFGDTEQIAERPIAAPINSSDSHTESKSSPDSNDIITDRQKIKETDEYKRAMEEEWASRQEQLQRQAEEARRLRNKKRAQNMRIMDNERRQRQRLEEVRETRRKDEENLNLKDKLRAQIRNELRKLETMCFDMASLLRALGIHVNGGLHPSSNEVQAAYKRACLRFHPDRQPTTDLRQVVEAEEKFKLISNMKDKLLSK